MAKSVANIKTLETKKQNKTPVRDKEVQFS